MIDRAYRAQTVLLSESELYFTPAGLYVTFWYTDENQTQNAVFRDLVDRNIFCFETYVSINHH